MDPDIAHLTASSLAADLMTIVGATILGSLALAAVALFSLRRRTSDIVLLSFAAFASLYAVRLFASTRVVPDVIGGSDLFWDYFRSTLTYVMPVPLLLFAEQVLGPGKPPLRRILRQIATVFAIVATAGAFVLHRPEWAMRANQALVLSLMLSLPLLLTTPPGGGRVPGLATMRAGVAVAAGFVLLENLRGLQLVDWPDNVEFIGFVALAISLAYSVTERFLGNEGRLAALDRELDTARRIQHSILPRDVPTVDGFRLHVRYVPMTAVAGDFYEFFQTPYELYQTHEGTAGVLVADVSGHGVPAALIASMVKIAATSHRTDITDPGCLLTQMNRTLDGQLGGQFVTAMCAHFDRKTLTVAHAGAGHPPILHWRAATRTLAKLDSTGVIIGMFPSVEYGTGRQTVGQGDRLAIYTDGLLEAMNPAGDMFGDERFPTLLRENAHLPGDAFADLVLRELTTWTGKSSSFDDDVTLVVVDVL